MRTIFSEGRGRGSKIAIGGLVLVRADPVGLIDMTQLQKSRTMPAGLWLG